MPFVPFLTRFRTPLASAPEAPPSPQLIQLRERVEALERAETVRAAEHADQLQQLERLYKRLAMRLTRAGLNGKDAPSPDDGESVLSLRHRLNR